MKQIPRRLYSNILLRRLDKSTPNPHPRRHSLDPSLLQKIPFVLDFGMPHLSAESNMAKNELLVALNGDASTFFESISTRRDDIVSMWKYSTRQRTDEGQRIMHSSWRRWFKHSQSQMQLKIKDEKQSLFSSVSSYIGTEMLGFGGYADFGYSVSSGSVSEDETLDDDEGLVMGKRI